MHASTPPAPSRIDPPTITRLYWLALTHIERVGSVRAQCLVERFGSPQGAFAASRMELSDLPSALHNDTIDALLAGPDLLWARRQVSMAESLGASVICLDDPDYPESLRQIPSPPPVLFAQGVLGLVCPRAVAVVGTRKPSVNGQETTRRLCRDWAANGIRIVSGLARGIDEIAHRTALEQGGETIAVLGCPLDGLGTDGRGKLAQQIASAGVIITEHPFGAPVVPGNFVRRNRIISGLAQAVVVTEAPMGSGALITARNALEQNRELLTCPGPADSSTFEGNFTLLRQGAGLCARPDDLWHAMGWKARSVHQDNPSDSPVVRLLRRTDASLEEIALETQTPIAQLQGELVLLEMAGRIQRMGGSRFRIVA
ncbi:MAG: DNA-processing protein DprA [Fibrobacterota bacterium]